MQPKYEVPIIPQNLRREETIVQIAEAIRYLSDVTNDIFDRINKRITTNNEQINGIQDRIGNAHEKLKKLSGAKKATQVFSSSKYPAADVNRKYISIFDDADILPIQKFPYKYKSVPIKDEPLETLQFFHVKNPNLNKKADTNGLGKVPSDVDMVNDLLLFNSGKNLYSKYTISDTLNVSHTLKKEDVDDQTDIGAAPISISDRTILTRNVGESYFYSPDLGNVPAIDVPLDLPDLPGIADDLRYTTDDGPGPGIAPSVTTTPNVPDLPTIISEQITNSSTPTESSTVLEDIKEIETSLPEILVEQPRQIVTPPQQEIAETVVTVILPPVTQQQDDVVDVSTVEKKEVPRRAVEPMDVRANLMEAIRNAGGKNKLKPRRDSSPPKAANVSKGTGDLMADLHAKLSMRRKGISGNKPGAGNGEPKSAMDKVSAMIPPPPTKSDLSENTEDDDWED